MQKTLEFLCYSQSAMFILQSCRVSSNPYFFIHKYFHELCYNNILKIYMCDVHYIFSFCRRNCHCIPTTSNGNRATACRDRHRTYWIGCAATDMLMAKFYFMLNMIFDFKLYIVLAYGNIFYIQKLICFHNAFSFFLLEWLILSSMLCLTLYLHVLF